VKKGEALKAGPAQSATICISEDGSPDERAAILEALSAYNAAMGYPGDMRPVSILLKDESGATVGGLWGKTVYDWMFVEFLIVPEAMRGHEFGTRLMREAEQLAISRGCVGAWLTTFSYQAQPFYEGLGYEVFGSLDQSPRDNVRIFMRKKFAGQSAATRV
jgi:GNAT superfamily N-acetyltransferase